MRPVCMRCKLQFQVEQIGIVITEHAKALGPYRLWNGDLWKCPGCGFEIIGGFGMSVAEHYQPDFAQLREHSVLDFHGSLNERAE